MLSCVSSRVDGATNGVRNGACSWTKTMKPSVPLANTSYGRVRHFGSRASVSSVRWRTMIRLNAGSDVSQNFQLDDDVLDSEEGPSPTTPPPPPPPPPPPAQVRDPRAAIDAKDFPFRMGDRVTITVSGLRRMGAIVNIEQHPDFQGYLPVNNFPVTLLPEKYREVDSAPSRTIYRYLKRNAIVTSVSTGKAEFSQNPILNAYRLDKDILFKRLFTIKKLWTEDQVTIKGYIYGRNRAGLVIAVAGFPCFMPRSLMTDSVVRIHNSLDEEFGSKWLGSDLEIAVTDIEPDRNRIIASAKAAITSKALKELKIGQLVNGRIQGFARYGAFVTINDTEKTGLLHLRNISGKIVRDAENIFNQGDEISALILDMNPDHSRIALSTADLEEYDGEMLYDRDAVMRNAPKMAARLQEELDRAREKYRQSGNEGEKE